MDIEESSMRTLLPYIWMGLIVIGSAVAVTLEFILPYRQNIRPHGLRWLRSLVLTSAGFLLVRLILPLGLIEAADYSDKYSFGLFNMVTLPLIITVPLSVLLVDAVDFARHRLMHSVPFLWRFHRLHHADNLMDASTSFRNHPIDAIFQSATLGIVVLIFGLPPMGVASYVVLMLAFDIWVHANIRGAHHSRSIAGIIVTPEIHRIHHSANPSDFDSNYGMIFAVWDRFAGTYLGGERTDSKLEYGLASRGKNADEEDLMSMLLDPTANYKEVKK